VVAVTGDRGQALVLVVFAVSIGVVAIAGLRLAQDRLFVATRSHRAGEAAVEAAAASVADAYVAHLAAARAAGSQRPRPTANVRGLVRETSVLRQAESVADDLSRANGGGPVSDVAASCAEGRVDIRLTLDGFPHRAGFSAPECSLR
jgi:hypothetical protein